MSFNTDDVTHYCYKHQKECIFPSVRAKLCYESRAVKFKNQPVSEGAVVSRPEKARCYKCREDRDWSEFNKNKDHKWGYNTTSIPCKTCRLKARDERKIRRVAEKEERMAEKARRAEERARRKELHYRNPLRRDASSPVNVDESADSSSSSIDSKTVIRELYRCVQQQNKVIEKLLGKLDEK